MLSRPPQQGNLIPRRLTLFNYIKHPLKGFPLQTDYLCNLISFHAGLPVPHPSAATSSAISLNLESETTRNNIIMVRNKLAY